MSVTEFTGPPQTLKVDPHPLKISYLTQQTGILVSYYLSTIAKDFMEAKYALIKAVMNRTTPFLYFYLHTCTLQTSHLIPFK